MTAVAQPAAAVPRRFVLVAVIWLVLAIIAGATGFLSHLPFPVAQLIIVGLTVATIAGTWRNAWVNRVSLRWLVGINGLRFVGIVFLILAAQGRLNPVFAARAGWGDIAVAALALILVLSRPPRSVFYLWNAAGLLDLLSAVATASIVPNVALLLAFPLSLIPTFVVPLLLANHIVIFRRLLRDAP